MKAFMIPRLYCWLAVVALVAFGWTAAGLGQTTSPAAAAGPQAAGSVRGTVMDQSGAVVGGARVKLVFPSVRPREEAERAAESVGA